MENMNKSVLVIDDDTDLSEVQRAVLEMDGFEVFTAQSGPEAFKILGEINKPELIILDVRMKEMSGPDFLILLEEKNPEIFNSVPVVFLTAMDQIPTGKVAGFIRKPFDLITYLEEVRRFVAMRETSSVTH